ncbi:MAG: hypothetical protein SGI86_18515 [Deltaproteobacteria bacterium]|nr:hypothetical protein [Deltaproteobacteria bacterium]
MRHIKQTTALLFFKMAEDRAELTGHHAAHSRRRPPGQQSGKST